jgi:hypothetical protein
MANASPVLYPSTESTAESELPTLVWRQRTLSIPPRRPGEPRPFSIEPIIELCVEGRLTGIQATRNGVALRPEGTIARTAEVLDVDRQFVYRLAKKGITANQADTLAIMFGLHPCLIWSDWFAHVPDEPEILAADELWNRRPAPKVEHRPPASLDGLVERLRKRCWDWKEIAEALRERGLTNWRNGRPWSAEQLESAYGDLEVSA